MDSATARRSLGKKRSLHRRRITMATLVIAVLAVCPLASNAQLGGERPHQTRFQNAVKSWRGSFSLSGQQSGSVSMMGIPVRYSYNMSSSGTVDLPRHDATLGAWVGTIKGSATLHQRLEQDLGNCTLITYMDGDVSLDKDLFGADREALLSHDLEGDTWSFWTFDGSAGDFRTRTEQICDDQRFETAGGGRLTWSPLHRSMQLSFPRPEAGYNLNGETTVICNLCNSAPEPIPLTFKWDFAPVVHELELALEPTDYDSWRPEAGENEDAKGNTIAVKATIRYADDHSPPQVPADYLIFELVDTSREPGISMNRPLRSDAKNSYDLKLVAENNPQTLEIKNEGQSATTSMGDYTTYTVTLTSYDWGGWTELKVTAVFPGGDQLVGHLVDHPSEKSVRIPKRESDSKIADAWLEDQSGGGADADDNEDDPVGDGNEGDGLTLYEEYRGFHENGEHIEGNPEKKDYFVLNLIGSDAEPGIWLFTELAELEVHKDLQRNELADDRLINANHDRGAHAVDQHGVILKTANISGAIAYDDRGSPPGPPKNTDVVLIEPRDSMGTGAFSDATGNIYHLSSGVDRAEAYDRAVAHELLHTVGVWHHGEGDYREMWHFHFSTADTPARITRPRQPGGTLAPGDHITADTPIRVTIEETGLDYAAYLDGRLAGMREFSPGGVMLKNMAIGKRGGQSSGNDNCVMRYYFSEAYEVDGDPNAYYVFMSQNVGLELDDSPQGTGNNESGRSPQARFFDASVSRGDKQQIVVNDAANPTPP